MSYEMIVTLTDQEYAALATEAAKKGKPPEALLRDMVQHLQQPSQEKHPLTEQEFVEKLYLEGKILNVPSRRSMTQEEKDERERLAQLFSGGKLGSDMVIEDRGPY
ncbi:MAG: hypothetical protein NVS4B11_33070 [Ktedonobacteraceae bacterium]